MSFPFPSPGFGTEEASVHVIDVDDVIDFLTAEGIPDPDEDFIGDLIDEVFAEFVAETGQPIENDAEYAWEFDHIHAVTATPELVKVNSISLLQYRSGLDWYTIDADTYATQTSAGWSIYYPTGFQRGTLYRATLDVGYTTIPADILNVVKYRTIERFYDSPQGKGRFGMKGEASTTSVTVTLNYDRETWQKQWDKVVKKYRGV
jgi:hypothetical protein